MHWAAGKETSAVEKTAQNIQDTFLNTARKEKVAITIYLLSGVKLTGRIRSFDKYSVVLETNSQEQLIFKHAISTVVMGKGVHLSEGRGPERGEQRNSGEPRHVAAASSSDAPATPAPQG
jgi:host factor-I protein